jgi:hypothetical protein
MAYRQLRKDSDAYKLSQIKTTASMTPSYQLFRKNVKKTSYIPAAENMINITTIPDQNRSIDNSNDLNNQAFENETFYDKNSSLISESYNSSNQQNNYVKTVKMLKQKDASKNKQQNKNLYFENKSHLFENPSK